MKNFERESEVECWFRDPVVDGNRAAVEWWGTWLEAGERCTLAGVILLTFDDIGLVVDYRDYWNEREIREAPYDRW